MKELFKNLLNPKFRKSYSQCGEDILINYVFALRGVQKPSYIDIGANDPFSLSNTALFHSKGSRGINIEANPMLQRKFERSRPKDINLNVGISDRSEQLDFYIMEDDTLSTFSEQECKKMQREGKALKEVKKIKLVTVDEVVERYWDGIFPDLLSIDVEGMDFKILKSIDFNKYRPKVICVEAAEYSPIGAGQRRNELIEYLEQHDFYEYANTNLNAIMVDRKFWFI